MIKIKKPNDFHHHLRENGLLKLTTKKCFDKYSLDNLEKFVSTNGCDCYNLPYNDENIVIQRESWIVPMYTGKQIKWKTI